MCMCGERMVVKTSEKKLNEGVGAMGLVFYAKPSAKTISQQTAVT